MAVELNHTIVASRDKVGSSTFLAEVLGLAEPTPVGHFMAVELANGVSLDYDDRDQVVPAHYAFLLTEAEFDAVFARVRERDITYYADPGHTKPGQIREHRGRGFYFSDPDGHNMEVLTRPSTG